MNKKQYLEALEKELRQNGVTDADDVLADYEAHFARKLQDGYTEEEIAHRLGNPKEIAADFLPGSGESGKAAASGSRGLARFALCLLDPFAFLFFLLLFIWAVAIMAGSLGIFALGGYIGLGMTWLSFIPVLPAAGGILMGLCIIAFSVLLFTGSVWFFMLAGQMTRAYRRWHGNRWHARHELALPVMPQVTGRKRRIMRRVVLVTLICFVLLCIASFGVLSIQAGTPGFWHYWHWFDAA